jgi:superfamily II DNA helicase RecQ
MMFNTQRIFLMETLPKRLQAHFLEQARLPPGTNVIRAPCNQPHISYIKLTNRTAMNETQAVVNVAKILSTVIGPDRRGIIFCPSQHEADQLRGRFTQSCCISYPGLPEADKARSEDEWKKGTKQWIAATAGFTLEVDSPSVGAVIFLGVGITHGMDFLYRGAGQSGRDGQRSWVVVLQDEPHQFAMPVPYDGLQDDNDPQCLAESRAWLQANQCRRHGFTMLYGDVTVSCAALPDAHFCDFCEPQSKLVVRLQKQFDLPLIS